MEFIVCICGCITGYICGIVGLKVADMLDKKFQQRRNRQGGDAIANNKFKD